MNTKLALSMSVGAAALMAALTPAQAGTYVSLFGGWNKAQDVRGRSGAGILQTQLATAITHTPTTTPATDTHALLFDFSAAATFVNSGAKAEDGFVLGATVGGDLSQWLPGLRAEFEVSLRRNNLNAASAAAQAATDTDTATTPQSAGTFVYSCSLTPLSGTVVNPGPGTCSLTAGSGTLTFQATYTGTANAAASSSGNVRTFALMANVWYDFDMGSKFKPYIGAGVGYATNEVQHGLVFNGSDSGFAWQVGAGVNYPISDGTSIGVGYRYMDAGDLTLKRFDTVLGSLSDTYDVQHHSVMLNVNFNIGK
jgi:opacity protein-like surface antigen